MTTNRCLDLAAGDYIVLLDHDDRLLPNSLAEIVRFINLHDSPDILYSDECIIDENGQVLTYFHKPSWSPNLHLAVNYTTHLTAYKTDLLKDIGGCRVGYEGAQDHDLMLRASELTKRKIIHVPICLYQWRSHPLSTASHTSAKPYAAIAGEKAVIEACRRRGRPAEVIFEPTFHHYRVKYQLLAQPLISIIIPSRNSYDLIEPCLDSIFKRTQYPNYELIIVDHESSDERCHLLYRSYKQTYGDRFRVHTYNGHFNFARMNNAGAKIAKGAYLLLLNNDTEVESGDWLHELLSLAQWPESGAVGAKLLYPTRRIQHAGIVGLGMSIAGNLAVGECEHSESYFAYSQTIHETLAVTGACLMVEKRKFESVGGLESSYVPNGFGDVDFCLKLRALGYENLYNPYAILIHKESVTRQSSYELFERYYMQRHWAKDLTADPYRNPSFKPSVHFEVERSFRTPVPSRNFLDSHLTEAFNRTHS